MSNNNGLNNSQDDLSIGIAAKRPTRVGWQKVAPMKTSRRNHAMSAIDDHRLVIATGEGLGMGRHGIPRCVELLDTKKNRWYDLPDLDGPCGRGSMVVLKDHLYVLGELIPNTVKKLAIDTIGAPVPDPERATNRRSGLSDRSNFSAVTDGTFIYLFGGLKNTLPSLTSAAPASLYDPETETWTDLPEMACERNYPAAVMVQDYVYVLGGFELPSLDVLSSVEVFNIKTRSWVKSPPEEEIHLPEPLAWLSAVSIDDRWILVTGGATWFDDEFEAFAGLSDRSYIYDTMSKCWCTGSHRLSSRRSSHAASVLGGSRIFISGGTLESDHESYDFEDTATTEYIDFSALYPSWEHVCPFVLLRKLFEDGRALVATSETDFTVEQVVTIMDGNMFRNILSFLCYCPKADHQAAGASDSKRQRLT